MKKILILTLVSLLTQSGVSFGAKIPDSVGIKCVLGEARGSGYLEMLTIAGALRNRGTTQGVHGCSAGIPPDEQNFLNKTNFDQIASLAWKTSKTVDLSNGAAFWASRSIDQGWLAEMIREGFIETKRTKSHIYFKKSIAKRKKAIKIEHTFAK
jgi:hypothetical protein